MLTGFDDHGQTSVEWPIAVLPHILATAIDRLCRPKQCFPDEMRP
jgi:hypothetical protein